MKRLEWLKIPGMVVGAIVAVVIILRALGFGLHSPGDELTGIKSAQRAQEERIEQLEQYVVQEQPELESIVESIDTLYARELKKDVSRETRTRDIEALVRGECLESLYDKLARQGLAEKCRELGIPRSHNDEIDQEIRGGG